MLTAVAAFTSTGCGGGGVDESQTLSESSGEPGPVHIHGLGVNPADGSLFLAAHTGLWRAAEGERVAERVGDSRQDTMGFTVVGPDHFLGSGHPDLRERDLPSDLGLIESRDGGQTWQPISLLGEADFHVLESAGGRLYGFDSMSGRLLKSTDGGASWEEMTAPDALLDLAVRPEIPRRVLAATERGLLASADGGRTWSETGSRKLGLLAWAEDGRVFLVDGTGRVFVGAGEDGGGWRPVGDAGGTPAAFIAQGGVLYVALHDGGVVASRDAGRSWVERVRS